VTELLACPEDAVANISGEICVLRLQGNLGPSWAPQIDHLIGDIANSDQIKSILVDASLLGTLDTNCVKSLAALREALRTKDADMMVYAAHGPAADALASITLTQ
jgi:anti-anti-sigma regulatory factor